MESTRYLLDSGSPYMLWSHDEVLVGDWLHRNGLLGEAIEQLAARARRASVEPEGELVEVSRGGRSCGTVVRPRSQRFSKRHDLDGLLTRAGPSRNAGRLLVIAHQPRVVEAPGRDRLPDEPLQTQPTIGEIRMRPSPRRPTCSTATAQPKLAPAPRGSCAPVGLVSTRPVNPGSVSHVHAVLEGLAAAPGRSPHPSGWDRPKPRRQWRPRVLEDPQVWWAQSAHCHHRSRTRQASSSQRGHRSLCPDA